jgi:transcriptional regulator of met regulon
MKKHLLRTGTMDHSITGTMLPAKEDLKKVKKEVIPERLKN